MLMILVMVVLRTRPQAIRKVFDSLETEGILGIEIGVNSAKGKIYIVLGGGT
jgi:nitrate reductase NapAB chaperone NapD